MSTLVTQEKVNNLNLTNIISKLTQNSYLFKGIDQKIIIEGLKTSRIVILSYKKDVKILLEGDTDCRHFFLLLKGSVAIIKNRKKICTLNKIGLIGELGFLNTNIHRTATVITEDEAFLMKFERGFIDNLPPILQLTIYKNISEEIAHRLNETNSFIDNGVDDYEKCLQISEGNIKRNIFSLIDEK